MGHPVEVPEDPFLRVRSALLAGEPIGQADLVRVIEEAASDDADRALKGSKRIFRDIVEPLCDRFDPELSGSCFSFLTLLISQVWNRPEFGRFFNRLDEVTSAANRPVSRPERPSRCLVLSRVTLGADVAVTSVVLDGLKKAYPDAGIALACGSKVKELFHGDERLSFLPVEYPRSGTLRERLDAWVDLLDQIEEWAGNDLKNSLIVNPDSRLTQLGVLPSAPAGGSYVSFDSRSYGGDGRQSIGEVTSSWMEMMFEVAGSRPYVALAATDLGAGKLLRGDAPRVAAMNWGFGGNETKRVSSDFETAVVLELLRRGWRVVVDKGFGEAEGAAVEATAAAARSEGLTELQIYEGPLSGFAGVIAASDIFVGYDSAAGHIAAALGVRGIDVFRGAVCERMMQRWSPWGKSPAQVVAVAEGEAPAATLARVVELLP